MPDTIRNYLRKRRCRPVARPGVAPDESGLEQPAGQREPPNALHAKTLAIVSATHATRRDTGVFIHLSFGRVIDHLAARCRRVLLCVPLAEQSPDESRDYRLEAQNIELIPQPFYTTALGGLPHPVALTRAFARACRDADALFIRGLVPYIGLLYTLAWRYRRRPCHWIVGNPVALLLDVRES